MSFGSYRKGEDSPFFFVERFGLVCREREKQPMKKTQKLTFSGVIIAIYVVVMYFTQSFAFGAYQIRIATTLYALSYLYPFLVLPLGLANLISNLLMGGMGLFDIVGGTFVGIITSSAVYLVHHFRWNKLLIIPPIIAGPGLIVPIWLTGITGMPYPLLALNLCIGQAVPAAAGYFLVTLFEKYPALQYHIKPNRKESKNHG